MTDTIPIGDACYWNIHLADPTGGDFDLTGCTVQVTVRAAIDTDAADTPGANLWRHTIAFDDSGNATTTTGIALGGQRPDGTTGTLVTDGCLTEHLTSAESRAIVAGSYVFDVRVLDVNGDEWTLIEGESVVLSGHVALEAITA